MALAFFALVGAAGLADFASQVSTMADADRTLDVARSLGIGVDALRTRINLLVPLVAVIAAVALSIAYGATVGDSRRDGRIICATLLAIYAAVQFVSGFFLDPRQFLFGAALAGLAAGAFFFVRTVEPGGAGKGRA